MCSENFNDIDAKARDAEERLIADIVLSWSNNPDIEKITREFGIHKTYLHSVLSGASYNLASPKQTVLQKQETY